MGNSCCVKREGEAILPNGWLLSGEKLRTGTIAPGTKLTKRGTFNEEVSYC